MFSLESPHRGDSNECSQHTIFNIKKNIPNLQLWHFFIGTHERVRNSRGKGATSVRATEVLLYMAKFIAMVKTPLVIYGLTRSLLNEKESLIPNDCHCGETNCTGYDPNILVST